MVYVSIIPIQQKCVTESFQQNLSSFLLSHFFDTHYFTSFQWVRTKTPKVISWLLANYSTSAFSQKRGNLTGMVDKVTGVGGLFCLELSLESIKLEGPVHWGWGNVRGVLSKPDTRRGSGVVLEINERGKMYQCPCPPMVPDGPSKRILRLAVIVIMQQDLKRT